MNFHGKRVALIGPAPIENDYRELIESCDIVVRINDALPIKPIVVSKTGTRCDVLYIWRKVRPNAAWYPLKQIRLKPDAIFREDWEKERHEKFHERLALIEPEFFYALSTALKTRVNTGMVAICEIASHKPSLLFITGITFYQSPVAYHRGYVNENLNQKISARRGNLAKHSQKPQLHYFVRKIYPLPFIQCDEALDKICQRTKSALDGQ
jgi:hypothetical protein